MGAAQFKEPCLQVLDELPAEGVVITKRGKPVARLLPFERSGGSLIGVLKGKIRVRGDLMGTGVVWDANSAARARRRRGAAHHFGYSALVHSARLS